MATAFRVSEAAALALHAVAMLTQHKEAVLTTGTIAAALKCSASHLSKVMQRLVRAGFVTSGRGPRGGFRLAKPPEQISLLDVLETIEGPLDRGGCLLSPPQCDGVECVFGALSVKVNEIVRHELTKLTAAGLTDYRRIPLPE
jgi:Rrf2 family protein